MQSHASEPHIHERALVVELIGDLDSTLGEIVAETIAVHARDGATSVVVSTKHVTLTSQIGMEKLDGALLAARELGLAVALEPGSRKMRTAFNNARIAWAPAGERPATARCLMIARHASPATATKAA